MSTNILSLDEESGYCTESFWKALEKKLSQFVLIINSRGDDDTITKEDIETQEPLEMDWNYNGNGYYRIRWSSDINTFTKFCCFDEEDTYVIVDGNICELTNNMGVVVCLYYNVKMSLVDRIVASL
jgi:hypothetical protein